MHIISINKIRRSLTRHLTRRFGVTRLSTHGSQSSIKTILICRPNHRLGNLLLVTPLLQELKHAFPQAKVDLLVKGSVAPTLFKNYENVDRIIALPKKPQRHLVAYLRGWMAIRKKRYDLVINAIHSSSSGKIATQFANGRFRFLGEINDQITKKHFDFHHMAKISVYSFRHFASMLGITTRDSAVSPLDLKLGADEVAEGKRLLRGLVKNENDTIGIYTYATGQKCYPPDWWSEIYALLKERFPTHNILEVLPIENVSQISFKAISYYSQNLREIASVLSNLAIFIAADSGMMHLGSASRTPVIGLFKSGNISQYEPYSDGSIGVLTDRVSASQIVDLAETVIVPVVRKTASYH